MQLSSQPRSRTARPTQQSIRSRQETHTLTITGTGDCAAYLFLINGTATDLATGEVVDQWATSIGEVGVISGLVGGGVDEYEFTGPCVLGRIGDGTASVTLDGTTITSGDEAVVMTGGDTVPDPIFPEGATDPCAGVTCPEGQVCDPDTGECVDEQPTDGGAGGLGFMTVLILVAVGFVAVDQFL